MVLGFTAIAAKNYKSVFRTIALAALNQLTNQYQASLIGMPTDPEDGGDVAYVCASQQFKEWGTVVYNSTLAVPELINSGIFSEYLNALDASNLGVKRLSKFRDDLDPKVHEEILAAYSGGAMSKVPGDLTYNNFANYSSLFLGNLSVCISNEFTSSVQSKLRSLDFDLEADALNDIEFIAPAKRISIGSGDLGAVISIRDNASYLNVRGTYRQFLFKILNH